LIRHASRPVCPARCGSRHYAPQCQTPGVRKPAQCGLL
jgi:hypothetical protein